ncbi:MAG: AMP-binding protein, partial [Planctomycetota bacterium]
MTSELTANTIERILEWRAHNQPDREAIRVEISPTAAAWGNRYGHIQYRDLHQRSKQIAMRLMQNLRSDVTELSPRVMIAQSPGIEFVASFFGCLYAGAIAVPVQPPRGIADGGELLDQRWPNIIGNCQPSVVLTSSDLFDAVRLATPSAIQVIATDDNESFDDATDCVIADRQMSDIAFLQYTSGSTGNAKGVQVTFGNLRHNLEQIRDRFEMTPESRGVIWLPHYHDMGLIGGILAPIATGFPVLLMSPSSLVRKPFRWLEAISEYGGTISGGPNFAYDLATRNIS